jgi:hypothetical protein
MADSTLRVPRGRDAVARFTVTHDGAAVDLTVAGTKVWFTAKRRKGDAYADAVITKTWVAGGISDGISIEGAAHNVARVQIDAADTLALTASTQLEWDCTLENAGGRVTVAQGTLRVPLSVSDPP